MKKNQRRVALTVTAQTAYHLKEMADACGHRDAGPIVDKLVREHRLATKTNKEKERNNHGIFHT